jgi:hypothetical protein
MVVFSEPKKNRWQFPPHNMQFQPMNRSTYGKPSKHSKVKCLKQDNKHGIGREKHWICLICPINPPHFGGDMIFGLYPPPRFRFPGKNHHVRLVSHHVLHSSGYNTQQNTDVLEVNHPSFLDGESKASSPIDRNRQIYIELVVELPRDSPHQTIQKSGGSYRV